MSLEAMKMALEFVEWLCGDDHSVKPKNSALKTRETLRQAIEQAEQAQPVAWLVEGKDDALLIRHSQNFPGVFAGDEYIKRPLVFGDTASPLRQPLTDEKIEDLYFDRFSMGELKAFARAIEAAHGIGEKA